MIRLRGPIPIEIHPLFWAIAALIGFLYGGSIPAILAWVGIVLVSVLFHEFGHALTAMCFRQKARIQLVALGGLTSYKGPPLKFWQQFLIVLNGPLAGFLLFLLATALLYVLPIRGALLYILQMTQMANLFWSIVNLLPVLPLDGGQLLRIALEGFFGVKGLRASFLIGAILAVALGGLFFLAHNLLAGAIFFLFAYQSFNLWQESRLINRKDRQEAFVQDLVTAQQKLQEGSVEEAKALFQKVRGEAPGGLLAAEASQLLALLFAKEGKHKEAYELLLPIREHVGEDFLPLLQELALEAKNYSLVAEISAPCYQTSPSQDVALRNAQAFAALAQAGPAGGWLQTAWQHGPFDLEAVLAETAFAAVRDLPEFKTFVDRLGNS